MCITQVMEVLRNLGTLAPESLQLTETHMRAMFTAIDANDDGYVDWFELVSFLCDAIEHIEREQYVSNMVAGYAGGDAAADAAGEEQQEEEEYA